MDTHRRQETEGVRVARGEAIPAASIFSTRPTRAGSPRLRLLVTRQSCTFIS